LSNKYMHVYLFVCRSALPFTSRIREYWLFFFFFSHLIDRLSNTRCLLQLILHIMFQTVWQWVSVNISRKQWENNRFLYTSIIKKSKKRGNKGGFFGFWAKKGKKHHSSSLMTDLVPDSVQTNIFKPKPLSSLIYLRA
jgi:hypothetical protein